MHDSETYWISTGMGYEFSQHNPNRNYMFNGKWAGHDRV